jgi:hypothetical protein
MVLKDLLTNPLTKLPCCGLFHWKKGVKALCPLFSQAAVTEAVFYPVLHTPVTPRTTHHVYVRCIIFSALWNRE